MVIEFEPQPAPTHRHDQFEVVADGLGRDTIDISLDKNGGQANANDPIRE